MGNGKEAEDDDAEGRLRMQLVFSFFLSKRYDVGAAGYGSVYTGPLRSAGAPTELRRLAWSFGADREK